MRLRELVGRNILDEAAPMQDSERSHAQSQADSLL